MTTLANSDNGIYILVGIIVVLFLTLIIIGATSYAKEFFHELRYLNSEIKRTKGRERKHWIRERRRLLLSLLPFIKY